jgi:hypothetical protein
VIIELLTHTTLLTVTEVPRLAAGASSFAKRDKELFNIKEKIMNKDLALVNILSLHNELMNATEMNELYCNQGDTHMSELWLEQMDHIITEMKAIGDD